MAKPKTPGSSEIVVHFPTNPGEVSVMPDDSINRSFQDQMTSADVAKTWLATARMGLREKIEEGKQIRAKVEAEKVKASKSYTEALEEAKCKKLATYITTATHALKHLGYELVVSNLDKKHLVDKGQIKFVPRIEYRRTGDQVEFFETAPANLVEAKNQIDMIDEGLRSVVAQLDSLNRQMEDANDPDIGMAGAIMATSRGTKAEAIVDHAVENAKRHIGKVKGVEMPSFMSLPNSIKSDK